jgi:4-amino-4-deoxy-L-arabinose transferase-like glycosyltransferase
MTSPRALWDHCEVHPRLWLLGTLALGLVFRATYFVLAGVSGEEPRSLDAARSLASGHGLRLCDRYFPFCGPGNDATAQVGPIPAGAFAAALRVLGEPAGVTAIVVLQLGLGLLTTLGVYALARRLFGSIHGALLAALLCASYPHFVSYELYPREEPLFAASLVGTMLALVVALRKGAPLWFGITGTGFAVSSLCRFAPVYFPLLLLPALPFLVRGSARRRALCALTFALGFAVVMAPWVWRNQRAFGMFVPGGTLAGYNLYRHNHILAGDDYLRYVHGEESESAIRALLARRTDLKGDENEAQMDHVYREEAAAIIRAHPFRYAALSAYRLVAFFTEYGVQPAGLPLSWVIVDAENLLILALALSTVLRRRLRDPPAVIALLLLLGYYTAGHALVNARLRYMVPVMPLFMILAADTLVVLASAALRPGMGRRRANHHLQPILRFRPRSRRTKQIR